MLLFIDNFAFKWKSFQLIIIRHLLHSVVEKEMATHFSTLAWKIPWMEEPGGLPSMGSHRVGHGWSNVAAAAAIQLDGVC